MPVSTDLVLGAHFNTADFFLDLAPSASDKKPTLVGAPALVVGKFGNAVRFGATGNDELNWSSTGLVGGLVQTGCVSFWVAPGYTGSPAADQVFYFSGASITNNRLSVMHESGGNLVAHVNSSVGLLLNIAGVWAPTAAQWYHIELNFDVTAGATRLFVDGTQFGGTDATVGVRSNSATLLNIGALPATSLANTFTLDELLLYGTVQHTLDFVPATSAATLNHRTDAVPTGLVEG